MKTGSAILRACRFAVRMSVKHLHRYVNKLAGRNNIRDKDTIDPMEYIVAGMIGKRLMYKDIIA